LDTPEDLAFLRAVYARTGNDDRVYWRDVLHLLKQEPDLVELNRHIKMKALQEG
jgi:spore coat polysaccharide biosynthesis protein SpsF (cytidylyltransferase family)